MIKQKSNIFKKLDYYFIFLILITLNIYQKPVFSNETENIDYVTCDICYYPKKIFDKNNYTAIYFPRIKDSKIRIWFKSPIKISVMNLVQNIKKWNKATEIELEIANGESRVINIDLDEKKEQSFQLNFSSKTSFIDLKVLEVENDEQMDGGFSEINFLGEVLEEKIINKIEITDISIKKINEQRAEVIWQTNIPTYSQIRYSNYNNNSVKTKPNYILSKSHQVLITSESKLNGLIEIRSSDENGNRKEVLHPAFSNVNKDFEIGIGGWNLYIDGEWKLIGDLLHEDKIKLDFAQQWLVGNQWNEWINPKMIRSIYESGYKPEIIHYFFGDPTLEKVINKKEEYLDSINKLADLIEESGIDEHITVTLEPEFNQGKVATWDGWNEYIIEAIYILRKKTKAKIGILLGDWDRHLFDISIGRAVNHLDFISFQEMFASTRHNKEQAYQVKEKIISISNYLSKKYLKPVKLGYLMISNYGNWQDVQNNIILDICNSKDELKESGLISLAWMAYIDRQNHQEGYFLEAEKHKGLKYYDNSEKESFEYFKQCFQKKKLSND